MRSSSAFSPTARHRLRPRRSTRPPAGKLAAVAQARRLDAKAGATLLLYDVPGVAAPRVLLVSLGARDEFGEKAFSDALSGAAKHAGDQEARDIAVTLAELDVPGRSLAWRVQHASRILATASIASLRRRRRRAGRQKKAARPATDRFVDQREGDA